MYFKVVLLRAASNACRNLKVLLEANPCLRASVRSLTVVGTPFGPSLRRIMELCGPGLSSLTFVNAPFTSHLAEDLNLPHNFVGTLSLVVVQGVKYLTERMPSISALHVRHADPCTYQVKVQQFVGLYDGIVPCGLDSGKLRELDLLVVRPQDLGKWLETFPNLKRLAIRIDTNGEHRASLFPV